MSYFIDTYPAIKYPVGTDTVPGFRNAQLGAIHGIGAHFTLHSNENALVVLPTGTGKTAVLTLTPFILQGLRTLVISSSKLVRGQITKDITSLITLKKIGAIDDDITNPRVKEVTSRIETLEDWNDLQEFDYVIGIPTSLSYAIKHGVRPPEDLFDIILVDEAHHSPAQTWNDIIKCFPHAKKVFFTATPFRRDKKEINGRIVYEYPISKAYKDGVFGKIGYINIPFDPESQTPEDKDLLIALEAQKVFAQDQEAELDHKLFVRTNAKTHANKLHQVYLENTNLNLEVIHSSRTDAQITSVIERLRIGELDGVICVDMLGEGFDFPNLKIGAIHRQHKSLAVTLQFIGRFARTNADNIGSAKFIAAEQDIRLSKNAPSLFQEGAVWNEIIFSLSDEAISEVIEERNFADQFETIERNTEPDYSEVTLSSFSPFEHLKIYRINEIDLSQSIDIHGQEVVYHKYSADEHLSVFLFCEYTSPKWTKFSAIRNLSHYLYILFYDIHRNLLFIHSSGEKSRTFYEDILDSLSVENFEEIDQENLRKILSELEEVVFYNMGLANREKHSGESYRNILGSAAHKKVTASSSRSYVGGHFQFSGIQGARRINLGYSSSSKVWGKSYVKISEYKLLCLEIARKISSNAVVKTNTSYDSIAITKHIMNLPEGVNVYACLWEERSYLDSPGVVIRKGGEVVYNGTLTDFEITVNQDESTSEEIKMTLESELISIPLLFSFQDRYTLQDTEFNIIVDGSYDLCRYLIDYPILMYLTDLTTIRDLNKLLQRGELPLYDKEDMIPINWESLNCDTTEEFKDPKDPSLVSIHTALGEFLKGQNPSFLVYDHGTGEIADYVSVKDNDNETLISLYHVKASDTDTTGDRVSYLYEVCGQAQKSLIWTQNPASFIRKITARVNEKEKEKMIIGTLSDLLSHIPEKPLKYEIYVVQPGLTRNGISQKLSQLLSATDSYIRDNGGNERLKVICSE